jgi:glycosyltransferase involved in cell wall biosynthesis
LEVDLERLGLKDRVRLTGFRSDVADIIAGSDIFCLSSVWEGVPLAAQEAIQLGVPVVATAVGGLPELIEEGISGRLVPSEDANALARALAETLDDRAAAAARAEVARVRMAEGFSPERMLDRLAELYSGESGA